MTTRSEAGAVRLRGLLVVVLLVAVVLVAADRGGALIAEQVAATTIENSQHLRSRPGVDIAGVPFLTQLAARDFTRITLTARDVPVDRNADRLDLTQVRVVLHGVSVARDFSSVRAATAVATASVDYAELSRRLGITVGYAGGGRITGAKTLTVLGRTFRASLSARPGLVGGAITFGQVQVGGLGTLANELVPVLARTFALRVPLQGVPFQVTVRSLAAGPDGLMIALDGSNISYRRS